MYYWFNSSSLVLSFEAVLFPAVCRPLAGLPDLAGSQGVRDSAWRALHHPRKWRRPLGGVRGRERPVLPQTLHHVAQPGRHGRGPLVASKHFIQSKPTKPEEVQLWLQTDALVSLETVTMETVSCTLPRRRMMREDASVRQLVWGHCDTLTAPIIQVLTHFNTFEPFFFSFFTAFFYKP